MDIKKTLEKKISLEARKESKTIVKLKTTQDKIAHVLPEKQVFDPELLKSLREKFNLNRMQAACVLEVTPSTIAAWESGKFPPRSSHIIEMVKVSELDLENFNTLYKDKLPAKRKSQKNRSSNRSL